MGASVEWTDSTALSPRWLTLGSLFLTQVPLWASSSGPWVSLQPWQVGREGGLSVGSCLGLSGPVAGPHHLCSSAVCQKVVAGPCGFRIVMCFPEAWFSSRLCSQEEEDTGLGCAPSQPCWRVPTHFPLPSVLQGRSLFSNRSDMVAGCGRESPGSCYLLSNRMTSVRAGYSMLLF